MRLYSRVSCITRLFSHLADALLAGRLKAACDLIAHHLPPDVKTELVSTYEYANLCQSFVRVLSFMTVSRPWTFM